jgi:hypothetical protein
MSVLFKPPLYRRAMDDAFAAADRFLLNQARLLERRPFGAGQRHVSRPRRDGPVSEVTADRRA